MSRCCPRCWLLPLIYVTPQTCPGCFSKFKPGDYWAVGGGGLGGGLCSNFCWLRFINGTFQYGRFHHSLRYDFTWDWHTRPTYFCPLEVSYCRLNVFTGGPLVQYTCVSFAAAWGLNGHVCHKTNHKEFVVGEVQNKAFRANLWSIHKTSLHQKKKKALHVRLHLKTTIKLSTLHWFPLLAFLLVP